MKITPLDIRRKEFKRSVRGYSDEEVDIFLDEVADEFERIFQENMELQDRSHRLDEQISGHTQLREALEKTLIAAQLQAEEIRANAHKESELILRDADMKARSIVSESYGETQRTQQALVQLKMLEEDFRLKFRSLLEGYLRLVTEAPLTVTGPEAALGGAEKADGPAAPAAEEHVQVTLRPAPVPAEAPAPVAARSVSQPAPPVMAPEARPVQRPEDEAPTEESTYAAADVSGTAETPAFPQPDLGIVVETTAGVGSEEAEPGLIRPVRAEAEVSEEVEPTRGFFFGRQIDNLDDTFPGEDGPKKDKTRDFEW
ncbi:MAG: hypothetical protein A2133_04475 [Actinobacteria bacterium RBG_16_64_13]|nr:MAG: hypothetical protein A2133_04475 [Actinobacteria bacterium RBG_16_64_13]